MSNQYDEMLAFAHAIDQTLIDLDVRAFKPVQGEAMHKVIGWNARNALVRVGMLKDDWLHKCDPDTPHPGDFSVRTCADRACQPVYIVVDPTLSTGRSRGGSDG